MPARDTDAARRDPITGFLTGRSPPAETPPAGMINDKKSHALRSVKQRRQVGAGPRDLLAPRPTGTNIIRASPSLNVEHPAPPAFGVTQPHSAERRRAVIACSAPHQASLVSEDGTPLWTGRGFRTDAGQLARLWDMVPAATGTEPVQVMVIMEPTRNAWVPLTAWLRRRGAIVVLVPP